MAAFLLNTGASIVFTATMIIVRTSARRQCVTPKMVYTYAQLSRTPDYNFNGPKPKKNTSEIPQNHAHATGLQLGIYPD